MKFILEYAGHIRHSAGHDNLALPKGIVLTNNERMEMCKIIADALKQFYNLDKNKNGDSCGCKDLLDRLDYLDRLKLHVGAHIHESHGILQKNNKIFVNASICTINHEPINTPIIVEL
jgi:hypothetical protein